MQTRFKPTQLGSKQKHILPKLSISITYYLNNRYLYLMLNSLLLLPQILLSLLSPIFNTALKCIGVDNVTNLKRHSTTNLQDYH